MPVVKGAAEAARELRVYLLKLAVYENDLANWQLDRANYERDLQLYERENARYPEKVSKWNLDRSLGGWVGERPMRPEKPAPFVDPRPVRPDAPNDLHHRIYNNSDGALPKAPKGCSYHEARVGRDRLNGAGQHRIVVLAVDATGVVSDQYCTSDHYGDNARNSRPSWTKF
jgi:hypothetical protein